MSTHKSKQELTRLAWITELRLQGHRQCIETYANNGRVCALGLLAEVIAGRKIEGLVDFPLFKDASWPEDATGLSYNQTCLVAKMNDADYTFSEIADFIAKW